MDNLSTKQRSNLRSKFLVFVFVLAVLSVSLSFALNMLSPKQTELKDGQIIDAGAIGPGQTMEVLISPKVFTGGTLEIGGHYDFVTVEKLPEGWVFKNSNPTEDPMQVKFSVAPDAPEGTYIISLKVSDEGADVGKGQGLPEINFKIKVRVTYDVLTVDFDPLEQTTSAGQPARYKITLHNLATTSDTFEVSSSGVSTWNFRVPVYVAAGSSREVTYEVVGLDESSYSLKLNVRSLSSDLISQSQDVKLTVKSNLVSDMLATNHGVLIFPIFLQPLYSLAGLLSNLF
ncbi:hypothetical protein FJZ26_01900 [Candidatus Parvarchaeota archaeon]|nr:hypothetical protein [Candidatus Parvarchaeota archaeon]